MTRRALWFGLLAILMIGLTASVPAAPTQAGLWSAPGHRSARASIFPRQRSRISPAILEYLLLPRYVPAPDPLDLRAAAAILMDAETGEVLFQRNPDERRPPASITKILTALVILDRGHLTDTVVVSPAAARIGGHRLGLRRGQRAVLEDLVAAILIRSANDAAVAAAEHVGESLPGFVTLMNAKAEALGMRHSNFVNPHGLDEPEHFTTARDLALLTRAALDHPDFARLVRTREATVRIWHPGRRSPIPQARVIVNHNKLLGRVEGADGVKTGYTDAAGRCLVASASRGGQRMIAVLLDDPQRWTDAATLLEFGFGQAGGAPREAPDRRAGGPGSAGSPPDGPWHGVEVAGGLG